MDNEPQTADDMDAAPLLSAEEARVVGCLVEKQMTTPDQYPMSLNGVTLASNQRSNRDPVVDYSEALVERTLRDLTDRGAARMVHRPGDRVVKYRHAMGEHIAVADNELALLAVLLLRGGQTPGELRQRTQRYVEFGSLGELEGVLDGLVGRELAVRLERRPGQKESRYVEQISVVGVASLDGSPVAERSAHVEAETDVIDELRAEVDTLRQRFEALLDQLGVDDV